MENRDCVIRLRIRLAPVMIEDEDERFGIFAVGAREGVGNRHLIERAELRYGELHEPTAMASCTTDGRPTS